MASVLIQVRVNPQIVKEIDNLAGASNLDRSEYLKLWLGAITRLKREYAVRAIADIPQDRFRGLPGRPREDDEDGSPPAS